MSFGYSVSDGVLLVQLAWKTVQGARQACGEHDELTREVSSLHRVLQRLHRELSNPDSLLNRADDERREELDELGRGCVQVLNMMNTIVTKYNTLSDSERGGKRIWQKVKFGNGEVKDLAEIRLKLSAHTSAIIMSLNLCSLGSQSRVEKQLGGLGGNLEGVRAKLDWIAAKINANGDDGTVWTSHANDDKSFWRQLRRELVNEGYDSSVLHEHKQLLKTYVKELFTSGAFDEAPEEGMLQPTAGEQDASGDQPENVHPSSTDPKEETSDDSDSEDTDMGNTTLETARSGAGNSLNYGSKNIKSDSAGHEEPILQGLRTEDSMESSSNMSESELSSLETKIKNSSRSTLRSLRAQIEKVLMEEDNRRNTHPDSFASRPDNQDNTEPKVDSSSLSQNPASRQISHSKNHMGKLPTSLRDNTEKLYSMGCSICLSGRGRRASRFITSKLKCGHRICRPCLKVIFQRSIIDPHLMPPKCCTNDHIPLKHVENLVDIPFKKLWNKAFQESCIEDRLYCPNRQCSQWIRPGDIKKEDSWHYGKCNRCKMKVCLKCKMKFHWASLCLEDKDAEMVLGVAKQAGWQQCYKCKIMVELQEGNNHMTCRCLAEFCMACGLRWKTCSCPLCRTPAERT